MVKLNQIKMGSFLSYAQMILNIVIGILYTPIMLRCLGQSEYGLYSTAASTISMLSILNLGFNAGYIRYYSRYKRENDEEAIYRLNGLFIIIFTIIGFVAFLCGLFLSNHLEIIFSNGLTEIEYKIAKVLTILLTISLTSSFIGSVFSNIITAHERFIFLKLLGMIRTVAGPMITLPVLLMGYKSIAMVGISVTLSICVDIIYAVYVIKGLKQKFYFTQLEKGIISDLFVFTSFIAINILIDQINWNIDKLLLGRFKGTYSVAVYSVGFTIYQYYQNLSTSVSGVFTPRVHRIYNAYADNELDLNNHLTELFIKVGRIQFCILGLVATGFIFFGKPFIHFWAGDGYEKAYYVAMLLIIPASIALIQNVGIEIQRAENKHKFRSIAYGIMAIFNLISSIILCQIYGEVGAAVGTAASLILANGIIMNVYYYRECGINVLVFWKNIIRLSVGLIIPIITGVVISCFVAFDNVIEMLLGILIYTIAYCASMWIIGLNQYEKDLVIKPIKKILKRK